MSADASREAFEAAHSHLSTASLRRNGGSSGCYTSATTSMAWEMWKASRQQALEEAAKIPREHAIKLADGPFGLRFPDEATAICNASTAMGEKIKELK